jgi:hypothetical protein
LKEQGVCSSLAFKPASHTLFWGVAKKGDTVQETEWVELVADAVRPELAQWDELLKDETQLMARTQLKVRTQFKLPYGYEIRSYGERPEAEAIPFATDFIVIEDTDGSWKPRVVVEAKVDSITTHDAITYSHKAANHKSVFPYLRYGIMLGNRGHYPLPGRLYRHGTQFDFMISFKEHKPSPKEITRFSEVLVDEVRASRDLENMIYESRKRDREHHTLLHRKLTVEDISA